MCVPSSVACTAADASTATSRQTSCSKRRPQQQAPQTMGTAVVRLFCVLVTVAVLCHRRPLRLSRPYGFGTAMAALQSLDGRDMNGCLHNFFAHVALVGN